jgi:hypothetical protein
MASSLAWPGGAHAAPAPDPARFAELRTAAAEWNRCRVFTARRTHEFMRLRADTLGVLLSPEPRRPAIIVSASVRAEEPKRIPWAEIERIEGARSHVIKGTVEGLLVGGILGGAAGFLYLLENQEAYSGAAGFIPLGLLVGGFAGTTIAHRTRWTPLYP